ncbi:MAG: DUF3822 family protein, partial [Prevotellaceae bacterium]|nr:DUF3822 family protein [Prevotellaceae bacterium]
ADGFSFAVFNPQNENISCFDRAIDDTVSIAANVKRAFREMEWLKRPFMTVNVLTVGQRFTLVPLEFFEDEQTEQLFYYNLPKQNNEWVHYNILKRQNSVVLFGMDGSVHDLFEEQYAHCNFYSHAAVLIDEFAVRSRATDANKLYVCVHAQAVDLYAFRGGNLILANACACKLTADRLYYILSVWKMLGFEQERDELHLCGDLPENDRLPVELQQYIRQLYTLSPARHLDLYAVSSCG